MSRPQLNIRRIIVMMLLGVLLAGMVLAAIRLLMSPSQIQLPGKPSGGPSVSAQASVAPFRALGFLLA